MRLFIETLKYLFRIHVDRELEKFLAPGVICKKGNLLWNKICFFAGLLSNDMISMLTEKASIRPGGCWICQGNKDCCYGVCVWEREKEVLYLGVLPLLAILGLRVSLFRGPIKPVRRKLSRASQFNSIGREKNFVFLVMGDFCWLCFLNL